MTGRPGTPRSFVFALADGDGGRVTLVPVEAKAKDDPVNRVQIAMQVKYAKHAFPTLPVRPLTVKLFDDGLILFMEFNPSTVATELEIVRSAHYRLVRSPL